MVGPKWNNRKPPLFAGPQKIKVRPNSLFYLITEVEALIIGFLWSLIESTPRRSTNRKNILDHFEVVYPDVDVCFIKYTEPKDKLGKKDLWKIERFLQNQIKKFMGIPIILKIRNVRAPPIYLRAEQVLAKHSMSFFKDPYLNPLKCKDTKSRQKMYG